jgi:hypothetical protein
MIYIVMEHWGETNGGSIKGVFDNEADAKKCEQQYSERWIEEWEIGQEVEEPAPVCALPSDAVSEDGGFMLSPEIMQAIWDALPIDPCMRLGDFCLLSANAFQYQHWKR